MSTPAAWLLTAALWAGCLLPGPWPLALLGGLTLAVAALAAPRRLRPGPSLAVAVVALALTGAGLAGGRILLAERGLLAALAAGGGRAALEASVVSEPRAAGDRWWFLVTVDRVDGRPTRERALLRGDDDPPALGERLQLTTSARPLGKEGFDAHVRRQHAAVALNADTWTVVGRAPPWLQATTVARERIRHAVRRTLPADAAALLAGLVTGDTRGMPAERTEQLGDAGLSHLVAVSGANVALVLAGVLGLAAIAGLGARGRRRTSVTALAWFVVLVRAEPSVLRATAVAALVIVAGWRGRARDPRHVLAMGALLLLLADPLLAGQVGFALSVSAAAGVLVLAPVIARRLPGPRPLRLLAGASIGAQAAVAPVLLALEGVVPLAAVPANLVAVPAAAVASGLGMAAAVLAQAGTWPGAAIAWLAGPALQVVLWAGATFADGPVIRLEQLASPLVVLLGGAALARRRVPRLATAALVAVVVVTVLPAVRGAADVAVLTVTMLDVGQGDAILVEVPAAAGTARLLVDGGPDADVALDELRSRGVRRLHAVALSHPHADHSGGLPAVLERMDVGALLVAPAPLAADAPVAASVSQVYDSARRRSVPIQPLAAGLSFPFGSALVEVLSPPADGSLGDEPNESSLVLRVRVATGAALLTGDAEIGAQTRLLLRPERLRAAVLKVPHHGGATNASGFFDAVDPSVALISVGAGNEFGHPAAAVLDELAGRDVRRTDLQGSVTVAVRATPGHVSRPAGGPYTRVDAARPPADVPPRRTGGAAAAARRRAAARRTSHRGRPRRHVPAGRRAQGGPLARPAHGVAVRHAARAPPA